MWDTRDTPFDRRYWSRSSSGPSGCQYTPSTSITSLVAGSQKSATRIPIRCCGSYSIPASSRSNAIASSGFVKELRIVVGPSMPSAILRYAHSDWRVRLSLVHGGAAWRIWSIRLSRTSGLASAQNLFRETDILPRVSSDILLPCRDGRGIPGLRLKMHSRDPQVFLNELTHPPRGLHGFPHHGQGGGSVLIPSLNRLFAADILARCSGVCGPLAGLVRPLGQPT